MATQLVIFGTSNILSDLADCAVARGLTVSRIIAHLPEDTDPRSIPVARRIAAMAVLGQHPRLESLADFRPGPDECYLLGPTTPTRAVLKRAIDARFALPFATLVHPTAYVSPAATLGPGVFVGANSVIAPGARLGEHVFVNRGCTVGHDTAIGAFSRLHPGCNLGGLSRIGEGVTVGIGATLIERLVVGDHAFIGAGAVVTADVAAATLVVGVPAHFKKSLTPDDQA